MHWQSILKSAFLLLYFFIAAQGAFYITGMGRIMNELPAEEFVGLRKLANPVLEPRLKALYLTAMVLAAAALLVPDQPRASAGYAALALAAALLLADLLLALRLNLPLNASVGSISDPVAARDFQQQWLRQILRRSCISVAGFVCLLLSNVFPKAGL